MNDMWKINFNHSMYAVLMVGILFSGCTAVVMEMGKKAFEDRNTEDQITDTKIAAGILSRLSDRDTSLLLDVNVDVWEQRALLTGTRDNPQEKQAVAELAHRDSRITKIYNDIQIVTKAEKETRREKAEGGNQNSKEGIGQTVDDIWINTKIEAQLIAKKGITSVNYRWRSVRNNVSLIGRANSSAELAMVLDIIKTTKGVESVKHYVEINPVHPWPIGKPGLSYGISGEKEKVEEKFGLAFIPYKPDIVIRGFCRETKRSSPLGPERK